MNRQQRCAPVPRPSSALRTPRLPLP
jgi:hypothetical protein